MNNLFGKLRFKTIKKSTPLYCGGGFFASRHWIFKTDWLLGLNSKMTNGLKSALARVQLAVVTAKVTGQGTEQPKIDQFISAVDDPDQKPFREIQLNSENCRPVMGFNHANGSHGRVAFEILFNRHSIIIDAEYFAALFFDSEIKIFVRGNYDPVVIRKNNETVGMIMPTKNIERE